MSKSESQKARIKLYRNRSFRHELADGLGLGGFRNHVTSCLDALLVARRLPSRCPINSRAAAIDAAIIMIAIGAMQSKAAVQMSDRLGAMKLCRVIDTSDAEEREIPVAEATDLAADLATVFEKYWQAPDDAFLEGICHTVFITRIADVRADDAATLVHISDKRRSSYSTATSTDTEHEPIRCAARGGATFMPATLANFANQLRHDLDGTAAAVRGPRASAEGTSSRLGHIEEQVALTGTRDETVISSPEFVRVLLEYVGGDLTAGGATLLRFELLGRATVGGIEYHRNGGPNEERKRLTAEILEIGSMAVETAECHPEGWVVVDAFGRPCCRLGEGQQDFHRGAEIIVFDSEDESARLAAQVNAQGDDPALPALSLSTCRFAKEAAAHAEFYRRIIGAEALDIRATGDVVPPL